MALHATMRAFTLVEVIVALGLLSVSVVAVLALQGSFRASAVEIADRESAARLADAIDVELTRLRDAPWPDEVPDRLGALSELIPAGDSVQALRLVAARDGARVIRESDADDLVSGLARRDRYYLIEVRQQLAPLSYTDGAGYLALTLTVKWPYQIVTGTDASSALDANLDQASVMLFNTALAP